MPTVVRVRFATSSKHYDYFVPACNIFDYPKVDDYIVTNTAMPNSNDTKRRWVDVPTASKLHGFGVARIVDVIEDPGSNTHTAIKPYIMWVPAREIEAIDSSRIAAAQKAEAARQQEELKKRRAAEVAELKDALGKVLVEMYLLPACGSRRDVFRNTAQNLRSRIQELTNEH